MCCPSPWSFQRPSLQPEPPLTCRRSPYSEQVGFPLFYLVNSHVHVKRRKTQSWRLHLQMQLVLLGHFSANFSKCSALGRGFFCSRQWSFVPKRAAAGLGSEIRQYPAQNKHSCDSRFSCGRLCAHHSSYLLSVISQLIQLLEQRFLLHPPSVVCKSVVKANLHRILPPVLGGLAGVPVLNDSPPGTKDVFQTQSVLLSWARSQRRAGSQLWKNSAKTWENYVLFFFVVRLKVFWTYLRRE